METAEANVEFRVIADHQLEAKVGELLDVFYDKRIASLQRLELKKKLQAKNPYLVRAVGIGRADEVVAELLNAHISSSDETLFGNEFFEPLAKWVAYEAHSGQKGVTVTISSGAGIDIDIQGPTLDQVIAVKSGTKVFNKQSRETQSTEFLKAAQRLKKNRKLFSALVGYCYGRKEQRQGALGFKELAGQAFWEHLSGDPIFYERIIVAMGSKPTAHREVFLDEYAKANNRFSKSLLDIYCLADFSLDWAKIAQLSSGKKSPVPKRPSKNKKTN